ncbi:unnamed protein product, partial [Adineta ricciae]
MATSLEHSQIILPISSKTIQTFGTINQYKIPTFLLIWLDQSIDEVHNNDSRHTLKQLRQVIHVVHTFTNVKQCVDFLNNIKEEIKIILISSGAFGQIIVENIHNMTQVNAICIYCANKNKHEKWVQKWTKVKGVFTNILHICEVIKQIVKQNDQNFISMRFISANEEILKQKLDQSFMFTQILKEILLTIDYKPIHFEEFLKYFREEFVNNSIELANLDKLEREYRREECIKWYTFHSFLYSMLNHALRFMEINLILKMGFYIRDLHKHIEQLHSEQFPKKNISMKFTVYRGQLLSQTDFHQLKENIGGLISFNNFLSTSKDRQISLDFACSIAKPSDMVGILFIIEIDPSIRSTPFANIQHCSHYHNEEEVLFSMNSVFRINKIRCSNID